MPRKQEKYCAKLVSDVLGGIEYQGNYRFDFLRGDPTKRHSRGVTLPVDAYYPTRNLVLEFREAQHYGDRFDFRDGRITAIGITRKEQRKLYDDRRELVLPKHGIRLLVIYDYQMTNQYAIDLKFIQQAIEDIFRPDIYIYNRPPQKQTS